MGTQTKQIQQVTMKGQPLALAGTNVGVGDRAPDVALLDNSLGERRISEFLGKPLLISVVPSLDTGVCDQMTRRFNESAAEIPGATILTISVDLPFAQARWCGAAGVDKVITLSDHRETAFGKAYGVLIPELRLLARAVFVVNAEGTIAHAEIVPELTEHPDYAAALEAAKP